jgi:hypothetical protein
VSEVATYLIATKFFSDFSGTPIHLPTLGITKILSEPERRRCLGDIWKGFSQNRKPKSVKSKTLVSSGFSVESSRQVKRELISFLFIFLHFSSSSSSLLLHSSFQKWRELRRVSIDFGKVGRA